MKKALWLAGAVTITVVLTAIIRKDPGALVGLIAAIIVFLITWGMDHSQAKKGRTSAQENPH